MNDEMGNIKRILHKLFEDYRIYFETKGYTKKRAAAALSISLRSVDNLINRGVLKTVRAGNRVIIQAESLKRFMKVGAVPYPKSSRKQDPLQP